MSLLPKYTLLKKSEKKNPQISIIIRTKNEEKFIGECLTKIFKQKIQKEFEVIIIDSGSTDRTVEISKNFNVDIYKIDPRDFNFGTSINLGLHLASSEYCVFLSAHAIPYDEFWLENLTKNIMLDSKIAGTYSRQLYYEDTCLIEKRQLSEKFTPQKRRQSLEGYLEEFDVIPNTYQDLRNLITFSNASSCIRKSVAIKYPFKELPASEDREWALNVLKNNYDIVYEPASRVYHAHNETLREWYKRIYINANAVYQFSGFRMGMRYLLPIIIVNVSKDILFLIRNNKKTDLKIIFSILKELGNSLVYWFVYAIAYFNGGRKK
ncbi:PGL/p-HBAD biosynthesis glycosyltransferase Rv2957/MT3031 [[Flavobacterium] thermophilum]|nr:PGL/p-HBAD biosynthesis glycosyltransferase Rv2957/MT3031 [[Flavobacterium] thermophilum]